MKISKDKALKLVDEKISQFQEILAKATYENRYDEAYALAGRLHHPPYCKHIPHL